jgi:orotate phosphoribosyltransferase
MPIIQTAGAQLVGIIIALDRQERGQTERSAIAELEQIYGIPVKSIINLTTLINYLKVQSTDQTLLRLMQDYQKQWRT